MLHICKSYWRDTCWNDSMMVSHLAVVKYLFIFPEWLSPNGSYQFCIRSNASHLIFIYAVKSLRTFTIYIIRKILCIYSRICRNFLFIQILNNIQCLFGRKTEFLITFHLQRCKVKQLWWPLCAVFLSNTSYFKWFILYLFKCFFTFLL